MKSRYLPSCNEYFGILKLWDFEAKISLKINTFEFTYKTLLFSANIGTYLKTEMYSTQICLHHR